jgi:peptidoglycan/xylan/chitin deacetylase (PgdA/CDA1 family)
MYEAPNANWPAGHRAAVILSFDVDGEYGEQVSHPDDPYWRSQTRYDVAGVERILRILDDFDVTASFCWVARAAKDHPNAVRMAFDAGHEITTHGWDHRNYSDMSPAEQRDDIERSRAALEEITGERPIGHKTPFWRFDQNTIGILQDLGFRWNMDIAAGDLPFLMQPDLAKPPLVQLPPSRLWDDYSYFVRAASPPRHVFEMWREDIDVLRAESGLMCLTFHPWVIGRPGPSRSLTMFLDYVVGLGDVWIARADHVALWWLEHSRQS